MRRTLARVVLVVLAFQAAVQAVWALAAPRSFYDGFPGGGRSWVAPDGPFNEHLIRDFGALNLALAIGSVYAFAVLTRSAVRLMALAWFAYGVPHLWYHAAHTGPFDLADNVGMLAGLALIPVAAVVLWWAGGRSDIAPPARGAGKMPASPSRPPPSSPSSTSP